MPRSPSGNTSLPNDEDPPLLTTTFVLAWLINVTLYFSFYFVVTIMALYAIRQFSASDALAGFASSSFVVGATVARLFAGFVVDRVGQRPVLLVALLAATVACAFYAPVNSLFWLIVVRFLHGFGYAFASTAVMAVAQSAIPPSRRAEGTGYFALGSTLAAAVGPALALIIVDSLTYPALFWITTGVSMAGLVFGLFLRVKPRDPDVSGEDQSEASSERFTPSDLVHPAVIPIGIFMLIVGMCYAGVITYLNAYSEERGLVAGASLFFVAYAFTMFGMRFVLGRVQDKYGDNIVMYFGMLTFMLSLILLAIAGTDWQVVVAGSLCGMGFGTLMPASQSIAVSSVPRHLMATGISTLLLLADIGIGLGPILLGLAISSIGYGPMYMMLAACVVVAAVFYQLTHGSRRGRKPHRPAGT